MSDVSIIIQGPLNEISLKNIPAYKKYGKVIVSCWDGYDEKLLKYIDDDVYFVSKKLPNIDHYNCSNIYYQASSTYSGLEKAETKFSIKVRSDESYSNLDVFVKTINENPERMITGDIFFWSDYVCFHISDHAIGGKTKNLLGTFDTVKNICETTPPDTKLEMRSAFAVGDWISKMMHFPVPSESLIMLSFLQEIEAIDNIGLEPQVKTVKDVISFYTGGLTKDGTHRLLADYVLTSRSVDLVKKHVRIVPTACMGDVFLNTHGHLPKTHARLIKAGSEELSSLQSYHEIYKDIAVGY